MNEYPSTYVYEYINAYVCINMIMCIPMYLYILN